MGKSTIFLCGHHSRYGLAHLEPLLAEPRFDVKLIVLASEARWQHFRELLSPDEVFTNALKGRSSLKDTLLRARGWLERNVLRRVRSVPMDAGSQTSLRGERVPIRVVDDVNAPAFVKELQRLNPELLLSAAYPQIFTEDLIALGREASVNFHPSALPRCRGAHPHFWSIVTGERSGGVTSHLLTAEIDAGDIVAQRVFRIDHLNYSQLYDRIVEETPALVHQTAETLSRAGWTTTPQDHTRATVFRNDRQIHHRIFWHAHTAEQIENLSRSGVGFCFYQGGSQVTITDARAVEDNRNLRNAVHVEPGTIIDLSTAALVVKTVDQCVEIRGLADSSRVKSVARWIQRRKVRIGAQFT
jgi:methionyl-tRNA formyltransferase